MFRRVLYFLLFCCSLEGGFPAIDGDIVCSKVSDIASAHMKYDCINEELISRAFLNFIDDLDPLKCYFIRSDIERWLLPSSELLRSAVLDYNSGDFSSFEEIFSIMSKAIERRSSFAIDDIEGIIPESLGSDFFHRLDWADDEGALCERIAFVRDLELRAAEGFGDEGGRRALARIAKRRRFHEDDILNDNIVERIRYFFTTVLKALASSFDAHTMYFTPAEAQQLLIDIQQRIFGIGVQIRDDLDGFTVTDILDEASAAFQDLVVGDRIVAVDGISVVKISIEELADLIRGEKGSEIILTVVRDGVDGDFDVAITREEFIIPDARIETSFEPFGDGGIAVIKLHSFYQDPCFSSAGDISAAIKELNLSYKLSGVVLDLRGNGGGLLSQAIAVSGLFITQGVVVSVKDSEGMISRFRDFSGKVSWDGPLIIVTDRLSASASEIVAQTLQDYGRAIVIGDDHTLGKGTFQTFTADDSQEGVISAEGEYKVTRGMYYTASGRSPQLTGVIPDIVVPGIFAMRPIGEKYAKYPISNDIIVPSFDDDMEDLPFLQRKRISKIYSYNIQKKLTTYTYHLATLHNNTMKRLENNNRYKMFLKDLSSGDSISSGSEDFQLAEALNITKDLVVLCNAD
ncbi:MAG: PDZ domain-containing protein [Waddliaceae bacterium]|jgi:carboxyl-terminal processing protease|nr:PDZ domain-containing protein [Waddliaceae bacterium]MBT3578894.1 PDZ domain-containing protein [Waddliaceae bacterium]MBT4445030.1 PDZ domain-containing protein [Waddliaceae bacterium]MBT6929038.1 PDZ domain-containing protein [Waddliaceae bacterium]MBT7264037.1 PDZ domain-containing protein [Waddliaceae bacterium]